MALIGLVRVTDDALDVQGQHQALDPICSQVFVEPASKRRLVINHPHLQAALEAHGPDGELVVQKVRYLAQSMIDGLEVLNGLHDRGITVRVLGGSAADNYPERSNILRLGREIAELRRTILSVRIKTGLQTARERGAAGRRPRALDDTGLSAIVSLREQGASIRSIAQSLGVSPGTVHKALKATQ